MDDCNDQLDFNFAADDLLEFPRDLGEEGWFTFLSEQRAAFRRLERKFGILLNRRVCVRLRGSTQELVGKLVLDSHRMPAPDADSIRLRIGSVVFEDTDIEACRMATK